LLQDGSAAIGCLLEGLAARGCCSLEVAATLLAGGDAARWRGRIGLFAGGVAPGCSLDDGPLGWPLQWPLEEGPPCWPLDEEPPGWPLNEEPLGWPCQTSPGCARCTRWAAAPPPRRGRTGEGSGGAGSDGSRRSWPRHLVGGGGALPHLPRES